MSNHETIYSKLLKTIVEHQLPPGIRLPEDKLSEAFNVSRTGIRKVLHRLAIEKFVLIQPNKGAIVNVPTEHEAKEVFDSRIFIETQLVPDIIFHWNPEHAKNFRDIVEKESKAEQDNDLAASIQYTSQFHYELAKVSGNSILAQFVEHLCYRSSLVIGAYGSRTSVGCECGHHGDLIDLLEAGKVEEAKSWMKHHLNQIKLSLNIGGSKQESIDFHQIFSR